MNKDYNISSIIPRWSILLSRSSKIFQNVRSLLRPKDKFLLVLFLFGIQSLFLGCSLLGSDSNPWEWYRVPTIQFVSSDWASAINKSIAGKTLNIALVDNIRNEEYRVLTAKVRSTSGDSENVFVFEEELDLPFLTDGTTIYGGGKLKTRDSPEAIPHNGIVEIVNPFEIVSITYTQPLTPPLLAPALVLSDTIRVHRRFF